jgi:hypothetical protein
MKQTIARFRNGIRGLHVMRRLAKSLPCMFSNIDCTALFLPKGVLRLEPSEYHETMNIVWTAV